MRYTKDSLLGIGLRSTYTKRRGLLYKLYQFICKNKFVIGITLGIVIFIVIDLILLNSFYSLLATLY